MNPRIIHSICDLAIDQVYLRRSEDAATLGEQAVDLSQKIWGEGHPHVIQCKANLAGIRTLWAKMTRLAAWELKLSG